MSIPLKTLREIVAEKGLPCMATKVLNTELRVETLPVGWRVYLHRQTPYGVEGKCSGSFIRFIFDDGSMDLKVWR